MRPQLVLLTITSLVVIWNCVSVAAESNAASSDSTKSAGLLCGVRSLSDWKAIGLAEGEERGITDIVEKARIAGLKALIPAWYAAGKTPQQVAKHLGITGSYPMITHKNWKVAKSFKKFYDKRHKSYP